MVKIPQCPTPTEPGRYLYRRRKGAAADVVTVRRNREGYLTVETSFGVSFVSDAEADAK